MSYCSAHNGPLSYDTAYPASVPPAAAAIVESTVTVVLRVVIRGVDGVG